MSKFKVGDTVEILAGGWDHPVGTYATVVEDDTNSMYFVQGGKAEVSAVNSYPHEFRLVSYAPAEAVEAAKPAEKLHPNIPAYVVMKGGDLVTLTGERDYARRIKARVGGKAAGAVIYKLTVEKEIR